jgi:hypothetical protein
LRLFCSDHGKWGELNLHEKFILSNGATIGKLQGDLLHWPFLSLRDHIDKMERYSTIGAEEFYKAGKKANIFTPYIHFLWGFFRSYIVHKGFLDGHNGYLICSMYAKSTLSKYKKLRQLNRNGAGK